MARDRLQGGSTDRPVTWPNRSPPESRSKTIPMASPPRRAKRPEDRSGGSLNLDLRAQLDDPVRRQPQKVGRGGGVAVHADEQLLAPVDHAAAGGRDDDVARQEIRGVHVVDHAATGAQLEQRGRHVGYAGCRYRRTIHAQAAGRRAQKTRSA